MNLNDHPNLEQLRDLFSEADDDAGHHVLWVDKQGAVHLTLITSNQSLAEFVENESSMKIRYETFPRWNRYVGRNAARVDEYMERLLISLMESWSKAVIYPGILHVDTW